MTRENESGSDVPARPDSQQQTAAAERAICRDGSRPAGQSAVDALAFGDRPGQPGRRRSSVLAELCAELICRENLTHEQWATVFRNRAAYVRSHVQAARQDARARRGRVLSHSDLAERLRTVLGLSRAENWNGYVPPRTDAEGRLNTSPTRAALVAICREATAREQQPRTEGVAG